MNESEIRVTCMAMPSCDPGDTWVEGESACSQDDARCYSRTLCEKTIWCSGSPPPPAPTCLAIPTCDRGDRELSSRSDCPDGVSCYSRSMCGRTIWCADR